MTRLARIVTTLTRRRTSSTDSTMRDSWPMAQDPRVAQAHLYRRWNRW